MSAQQPDMPDQSLPAKRSEEVDKVRDAFEAAWAASKRPRIELFIEQVEAALRAKLKEELLVTELHLQMAQGERPKRDAYVARFPDCGDLFDRTLNQETTRAEDTRPNLGTKRPRSDLIGKALSHYSIIEHLGSGGMGDVYLAEDTRLGRKVALKVLSAELTKDQDRVRRFQREARAASALNHPHIVTIHDIGESAVGHFIAMEYVKGQTLGDRISQRPVPVKEIIEISIQVADALDAAHQEGIIHRDIKPSNISINERGQVKVLDFGLAKRLMAQPPTDSNAISQHQTLEGTVLGTPKYMSPEQALGKEVDHRTDIFSLGVLLYQLTTGQLPFAGTNFTETVEKIIHSQPQAIARFNYEAPPELERIILKCLEKDPDNRYQSAKELFVDLRRLAPPVTAMAGGPDARLNRRCRLVVASSLAVLLLAALAVGLNVGDMRGRLARVFGLGAAPGRIESLAVLPLENLSGDTEDEFFADGMTDALIVHLGQIGALRRVISRTSVMQYKNVRKPLPEIARELNVAAVIEGSVLRAGERVRVIVKLVQGEPERQLWSNTYERPLSDVLALQSELAQAIADQIQITLTPEEKEALGRSRPVDPEAYLLYGKGRYFWNQRTEEGFERALEYFNQAIEKDPTYALAHAGVAYTYLLLGHELYSLMDPHDAYPKAKAAARRSLELDDTLAEAHVVLADSLLRYDWDFAAAEREYQRAIALNPNYATAHQWYSHCLLPMGREEESLAHSRRAQELDPLNLIMNLHLGWHYFYAGEHDLAIEQLRETLELNPDFIVASLFLGQVYEQEGWFEEAIAQFQKGVRLSGRNPVHLAALAHAYGVSGRQTEAERLLGELIELSTQQYVPSYEVAVIYAGLDQQDQALKWLWRAYEQRDSSWLVDVALDPRFERLRAAPRFQELTRGLHLD